jgi:multisubunit Na+/H+ antiporter MnhC subunit
METSAAYLDLLGFAGLVLTAIVIACAMLAYGSVVADLVDPEQHAYDRAFLEIVSHLDG